MAYLIYYVTVVKLTKTDADDLDLKQLPDDVGELKDLVGALHRDNDQLVRRVEQLLRQLYGKKSEVVDRDQLTLSLFGDAEPVEETEEVEAPPVESRPKKRKGHGRESFPSHLPRERIEIELPEAQRTCSCCGKDRIRIGEDVTERAHVVPAKIAIKQYVRGRFACPDGHAGVVTPPAPPNLVDKAKCETSVYAHVVTQKYADHLPLHRLQGIMKRQGIPLSKSLMWDMCRRSAELLAPIVLQMKTEVLTSKVIGADETPIQVLTPGQKGSRRGQIWVYHAEEDKPVFDFTTTRERDGPRRFLGDWSGSLLVDGYSGYDEVCAKNGITRAGCWVHARRYFEKAFAASRDAKAATVLTILQGLFRIESMLRKRRDRKGMTRDDFVAMRSRARDRWSRGVVERFYSHLDELARNGRGILPKSLMGKGIDYAFNQRRRLEAFLEDGELDADNNASERLLRNVAVGRNNWLFAASEKGARTTATLYSLTMSCKALGIDTEAYVADVLDDIAVETDVAKLTPWAWAQRQTPRD